jgi:hypothetical protein
MANQVRITVPNWIVELKGWENAHIELVAINVKDDDIPITKETTFVVKEVKKK